MPSGILGYAVGMEEIPVTGLRQDLSGHYLLNQLVGVGMKEIPETGLKRSVTIEKLSATLTKSHSISDLEAAWIGG